ncbi:DUF2059 domain-containing protein [Sphingosinithalassobacter portus]|uniref:DUF2059 domain-containing protein n=1 Tax=Stakelama portus TaxID=2676234 RepID=UPI000D6E6193|nr:DUF2059 domain-containing protein [Sphingosinithalassobacter portus]
MKQLAFFALAFAVPLSAHAQTAEVSQSVEVPAIDPARLAAADALLDVMMPPERLDALVDGMLRPMMANMRGAISESPDFQRMAKDSPEMSAKLDRYLSAQLERTIAMTREAMPEMIEAMKQAYARNFSVDELNEMAAFFGTPTGQAYIERMPQVMADPAILAVQRNMMQRAMAEAQQSLGEFMQDLSAEGAKTAE